MNYSKKTIKQLARKEDKADKGIYMFINKMFKETKRLRANSPVIVSIAKHQQTLHYAYKSESRRGKRGGRFKKIEFMMIGCAFYYLAKCTLKGRVGDFNIGENEFARYVWLITDNTDYKADQLRSEVTCLNDVNNIIRNFYAYDLDGIIADYTLKSIGHELGKNGCALKPKFITVPQIENDNKDNRVESLFKRVKEKLGELEEHGYAKEEYKGDKDVIHNKRMIHEKSNRLHMIAIKAVESLMKTYEQEGGLHGQGSEELENSLSNIDDYMAIIIAMLLIDKQEGEEPYSKITIADSQSEGLALVKLILSMTLSELRDNKSASLDEILDRLISIFTTKAGLSEVSPVNKLIRDPKDKPTWLIQHGLRNEDIKRRDELIIATTTSFFSTGLATVLAEKFTDVMSTSSKRQISVKHASLGSGEAVSLLRSRCADMALIHSPFHEELFLASEETSSSTKLMRNNFVLVGPPESSKVKPKTLMDALRYIYNNGDFLSRNDFSGTHLCELQLWKHFFCPSEIGLEVTKKYLRNWEKYNLLQVEEYKQIDKNLLISTRGMEEALRTASVNGYYIISDAGTFSYNQSSLKLEVFFRNNNEKLLNNDYSLITLNSPGTNFELAKQYRDFVSSAEGKEIIASYVDAGGNELFTVI